MLSNPCLTLFRVRFCCLPMNSSVRTRCTADCNTKLHQVCLRDLPPTWRQRKMDNLTTWGLNSLCNLDCSLSDIPRKTTKSIPTVDIPSTLFVHPSKHCSFHDSISGHVECCQFVRGAQDIDHDVALDAIHLQLPLLLLGGNRQLLQTQQRVSSNHFLNVAFQPSSHLNLKMECDTSFPTRTSRANFNVRVCLFTSRMADPATPLGHARQLGIHAKPTRQMGLPTKSQC